MTRHVKSVFRLGRVTVTLCAVCMGGGPAHGEAHSEGWPQWGGATRDFKLSAAELSDRWPDGGPQQLWRRKLGAGFSSITAHSNQLYTMYRKGEEEIVVALRADSGETVWEHCYHAPAYAEQSAAYGQGPAATPLVLEDSLISVGFTGLLHCLDLATGKPRWKHDLVGDFNGQIQYYGYSNSPIAYQGNIIILVGGETHGVLALNPGTGEPIWRSGPFDISYAAPVLINVDGQDQVVFFTTTAVVGLDPTNGATLWSHPVVNFCRTNCTAVIWGDDNLLWAATKGVGGTRVLRLSQRDGKTTVEKVWDNRKIRIYHWNAVRVGDFVYTSSGDSQKLLSVIDMKTGEVVDRQRGFGSTNGIYADGKLIFLDDGGQLALAKVSPGKLDILSRTQVLDSLTWTPPTLVGHRLYLRDNEEILALDIGKDQPAAAH